MNFRPAKALIDLGALKHNLEVVKHQAPNSKVMAVIKANGYGHGIIRVAKQLSAADGFGVASIDDALLLRQEGFLHRILLLEGLFNETELEIAIHNRFDLVIHSQHQLQWLLNYPKPITLNIWIKIDTGMHRLGFHPDAIRSVTQDLTNSQHHFSMYYLSHFSCADETDSAAKEFTLKQIERFHGCVPENATKSLANSAAVFHYPNTHLDWIRPGISLYGAGEHKRALHHRDLKPVMRLESQIQALHWIQKGESVGYGNTWTAKHDSLIAVIAIGYGDGYPRHAPNGTPVIIHNQKLPLAGRVSMDMITVDVTKIADKVAIGDQVILWGVDSLTVDDVAKCAGTIGYELLCGVTRRVPMIEQ